MKNKIENKLIYGLTDEQVRERIKDSEIQLFTPYKQIEKILLDRYEKMHKQKV